MNPTRREVLLMIARNCHIDGRRLTGPAAETLMQAGDAIREMNSALVEAYRDPVNLLDRLLDMTEEPLECGHPLDCIPDHEPSEAANVGCGWCATIAELAALRIENEAVKGLLTAARGERDEARDKLAEVSTALDHEAWADTEIRRIYGVEFGLHQEGDSPPCWEDFANHIRELSAAIENERGEGTGPSEGWEWTGELGGNEWRKREGAPDEDSEPIDLYVRHRETWYEEGTDERPWAWHVAPQLGQGDEGDDIASGAETTARAAMKAADAALATPPTGGAG